MARVLYSIGLPDDWQDFYDFLEFARQQVPGGSSVYVLPADNTFWVWAKYWLYPDLRLVESSKVADYILSFNVDLPTSPTGGPASPVGGPGQVLGFAKFKQFAPNKFILKRKP